MRSPLSPRVRALGVAAVLSTVLTAGCGLLPPTPAPVAPSVVPDSPLEALAASAPTYGTGTFRYAVTHAGAPVTLPDFTGTVNVPGRAHESRVVVFDPEYRSTTWWDTRIVADRGWTRIRIDNPSDEVVYPDFPKKWMLVDPARLKDSGLAPGWSFADLDPGDVKILFQGLVTAERTHPHAFTGTLDLTRAAGNQVVDADVLAALGPKAKSVPFDARLDTMGRLLDLALTVPASAKNKRYTHLITYRDYGTAPSIGAPRATEVTAATPDTYDMLNS